MVEFWGLKKSKKKVKKIDMNWSQAKKRYPNLNPLGDTDKDGVKNKFDCKPFDKTRHMTKYKDPITGRTFQTRTLLKIYGRPRVIKEIERIEKDYDERYPKKEKIKEILKKTNRELARREMKDIKDNEYEEDIEYREEEDQW